ncbi:MAG: hypothetical protein AAFU73_06835 [Planctomycetota bacterium]
MTHSPSRPAPTAPAGSSDRNAHGRLPLVLSGLLTAACSVPAPPELDEPGPEPLSVLPLNTGTLSLEDFQGVPLSAAPNPYGEDALLLSERSELALFLRGDQGVQGPSLIVDDALEGFGTIPGSVVPSTDAPEVLAAASGDLDDDPALELVRAVRPSVGLVQVEVGDLFSDGSVGWTPVATFGTYGPGDAATLAVGNFDDDEALEIALTSSSRNHAGGNQSWLKMLDDSGAGYVQFASWGRPQGHVGMEVFAADVDGNGIDEAIVGLEGDTTSDRRYAVRTFGWNDVGEWATLKSWTYLEGSTAPFASRLAPGDFDGDGADELLWVGASGSLQTVTSTMVRLYAWSGSDYDEVATRGISEDGYGHPLRGGSWDVVALRRAHDGPAFAALARGLVGGVYTLDLFGYAAGSSQLTRTTIATSDAAEQDAAARVCAADTDADGDEEVFLAFTTGFGTGVKTTHLRHVTTDATPVVTDAGSESLDAWGMTVPPVMTAADVDGDGLHVRFTGFDRLGVADPIPLVLLTAAPTKEGISQNYVGSSTTYSIGAASGSTVGVTSATTMSFSSGLSVEDVTGAFGASVRSETEVRFAETNTRSESVTTVDGFSGSADDDVLVFQGNLYRSYEYEVVASPRPEVPPGTLYTIDVPIGANVYKWTVDFYNQTMIDQGRVRHVIGADLLPHTIGDPATYRSQAEVAALVNDHVGWRSPNSVPVGQGALNNSRAILLEDEETNETQLEVTLSLDAEFKAGYGTVGFSVGATGGTAYAVSVSELTAYEGVVGDIDDTTEWADWVYGFGLAAYQNGVLADGANQPTGEFVPGTYPLTVVTFWTELLGTEY